MATLIRGAYVLTLDPQQPVIRDGAVMVDGTTITAIAPYEQLRRSPAIEHELGDASAWIIPGFVNAHYHNWRTFSMGATLDAPLELFLLRLSGLEFPDTLGTEFTYLNTLVSAMQLVRSGVTLTVDMSSATDDHAVIQAYLDLGLDLIYAPTTRTQLGYVYTDDAAFLATLPNELRQQMEGQGLGLTGSYQSPDQYWQRWLNLKADWGDRMQLILAPDGPEWCSADELRLWSQRAQSHQTCLHLHNSESPMEMQWALQTRQQTMTEYLAELGFLGANVSCGHGVWYSDRDIELLVQQGATTVHCPSSNLRLSNGIAPIADYLHAGMNVALGTDGQGLADDSDFLTEMRLAAFLQRTPGLATRALEPWTVFEMATQNGARAFQREQIGLLKPGYSANLVVLDGASLSYPYLWPGHDPYRAVLQRAQPRDIQLVMSRGQILSQQGRMTRVDEATVVRRLQELYDELWRSQSGKRRSLIQALEPYVVQFFEPWAELPITPRYHYNRQ